MINTDLTLKKGTYTQNYLNKQDIVRIEVFILKNIIFVAEVRNPYIHGSSTQIMTYNLLAGLRAYADNLQFIAILDKGCPKEPIFKYYKKLVDTIIPVYTKTNLELYKGRKYMQLFNTLRAYVTSFWYKKIANYIKLKADTILISHSPSEECIFICKEIKKKYPHIKYIQYWSDPIALSGIYPEKFNIKRYPMYFIERSLLKKADKIVYGTKTLMDFQKVMYKKYSSKMNYVDISYSPNNIVENKDKDLKNRYLFGYSGNYMKRTRNIMPLYQAFSNNKQANLFICGTGDADLMSKDNIKIAHRYPQSEINKIEAKLDVIVCICNHSCFQIPGKVFYQTNTDKIILIILDGKYAEEIRSYLEEFNRFEFCYNNQESISAAIDKICSNQCKVNLSYVTKLSPQYIAAKLCE